MSHELYHNRTDESPETFLLSSRLADLRSRTALDIAGTLMASPRRAVARMDGLGVTGLDLVFDDVGAVYAAAKWWADRPPAHWTPEGVIGDSAIDARLARFALLVIDALAIVGCDSDHPGDENCTGTIWSVARVARLLSVTATKAELDALPDKVARLKVLTTLLEQGVAA